jgi:hypothetical protein
MHFAEFPPDWISIHPLLLLPWMLCSLIDCVDVAEQPGKKERNIRLFVSVRGGALVLHLAGPMVRPATTKEIVPI